MYYFKPTSIQANAHQVIVGDMTPILNLGRPIDTINNTSNSGGRVWKHLLDNQDYI